MELTSMLALCVLAAMLCILLLAYKPEYAMAAVLVTGAVIFIEVIKKTVPAVAQLGGLLSGAGLNTDYFKIAFKALGICYVTQFAADICRDFGQNALAAKAELAGKSAVFLLSIPLLQAVTEIAVSFVKSA